MDDSENPIMAGLRAAVAANGLHAAALVNEAHLKLHGRDEPAVESRRHFYFIAARAMRHVIVEHARARLALMRGGELRFFTGLEVERVAERLGTSTAMVKRDTRTARAFLTRAPSSGCASS